MISSSSYSSLRIPNYSISSSEKGSKFASNLSPPILRELINIIIIEYPDEIDENQKEFIIYPMTVLEIMALDVAPIIECFFEDRFSDVYFLIVS